MADGDGEEEVPAAGSAAHALRLWRMTRTAVRFIELAKTVHQSYPTTRRKALGRAVADEAVAAEVRAAEAKEAELERIQLGVRRR